MQILDGKLVSATIKQNLKEKISRMPDLRPPHLAAILIGNNTASETYVANKIKSCEEAGFSSSLYSFDSDISKQILLNKIQELNEDEKVDGILVQLPLPSHISESEILEAVHPSKDVDGFHPLNAGRLMQGKPCYVPATPYGIMLMLEHYKINTAGKHAVVIGRSNIVGRPMSILLSGNSEPGNCTVTVCHSRSKDIEAICKNADIIVAAIGKAGFVKASMVREGAIVIDVGINRVDDPGKKSGFRLTGDVDFAPVAPLCSFITPVPGGVGPMTIAALMKNTFRAWADKFHLSDL
jgi:methylenetetrahydrofolate dehydrogenase (NADP+)/methenyltetrahydrofolate cyclohydrolase